MRMSVLILLANALWLAPAQAAIDEGSQQVLDSPAIVAIGQGLNAQHDGKCVLPSRAEDIWWGCTGAIAPVAKPTIQQTGCFFSVDIKCPNNAITRIHGNRLWYLLVEPEYKVTQTTQPVIEITDVSAFRP